MLDTFASSYYNKAYMWPGQRAYWRNAGSFATGSPSIRADIMGRESSLRDGNGSVARHASRLRRMVQLGATGWSWSEVLPYFRKLETDFDFYGAFVHGDAGPNSDPAHGTGAVAAAIACHRSDLRENRQMPRIADMDPSIFATGWAGCR